MMPKFVKLSVFCFLAIIAKTANADSFFDVKSQYCEKIVDNQTRSEVRMKAIDFASFSAVRKHFQSIPEYQNIEDYVFNNISYYISDNLLRDISVLTLEENDEKICIELTAKVHTQEFNSLIEKQNFKNIDEKKAKNIATYIQNYAELKEKRMQSDSIHQQKLLSKIANETDMNRRCVYAMEYAHSSTDGPYFTDAVPVLVNIMCMGEYSPILYDIWRTWRTMQAMRMGMSRDSAIPNLQYNALRLIVAHTMLNHIIEHPDDEEAIRAFLYLSACANINRYGDFLFGNQNFEEQMITFPEYVSSIIGD